MTGTRTRKPACGEGCELDGAPELEGVQRLKTSSRGVTEAPAVGQQPQCEAPRAFEGRGIEGNGGGDQ